MTPSPDYDVLEGLAKAVIASKADFLGKSAEDRMNGRPDWWIDHRAFADASTPETILALIAKARAGEAAVEALPDLTAVIAWLQNGCDPVYAITELAIHQGRIDRARTVITKDQPQ